MIQREHYLSEIRPFYESDLVKVITGIRRCGKSIVLEQIKKELAKQEKDIIYLNFEDRSVSLQIENDEQLIKYIEEKRDNEKKCYVFLDEVQTVKNWNLACRTLWLHNISLFITGSNSKLLSKEFTKELSGRYVAFEIRPFVYKEILQYAAELKRDISITDYLVFGGFPKRLEFSDKKAVLQYLNDLDETIVLNDIMNRYKIRKEELFRKLVNYILVSNARIFSSNSVHNYLKSEKMECSINTVMKYLNYLEEAYVIRKIPQYSSKAKKELDFYAKVYDEDVAFNTIRQKSNHYDLTHNFENIIYNELIFMGYKVYVYNNNGREIDFLASKENKEYLIQVAYSVADEIAYKREFSAFNNLDQSRKKILITNDDVDYSTSTVEHIKFKDFLCLEKLH